MARSYYPRDALLTITAAAVTLTASDTDGVADAIIDMGAGRFDGQLVMNLTTIKISANDESYDLVLQGSNSATFASGIQELARYRVGPTEVRSGAGDSAAGVYVVPFSNEKPDGTEYRYARLIAVIAGTSPSIVIGSAYLSTARDAI